MAKSGRQIGAEHVERLRRCLEGDDGLPMRGGQPNITAIARICGFDRQVFYTNPECKRLLARALGSSLTGRVGAASDRSPAAAAPTTGPGRNPADARRIVELERELAALERELTEHRRERRRLAHVEAHMARTGRLPR